jgi:protein SEY1
VYAFDNFKGGVNVLQSRFYDSATPDFLLKPNYHKGVPADGFPRFAEAIWGKIVSNRDLDLPTQQQLLAQYRCDEISKVLAFKLGCVQSFYFEYK